MTTLAVRPQGGAMTPGAKPVPDLATVRPTPSDHRTTGPGQAVAAWLAGCAVAALTGYWGVGLLELARGSGEAADFLIAMVRALPGAVAFAALAAFLTSIPMPLIVFLERACRWPRGLSDLLLGAFLAGLMVQIFDVPLLQGPRGWAMTGFAALCGAMGGLSYWVAAGRPDAKEV